MSTAPMPDSNEATQFILQTGDRDGYVYFSPTLYRLTVYRDGAEKRISLGYAGSRLLERLLRNPGELVERDELLSYAWTGRVVGQGSLNQQIHTLRRVLSDADAEIIQTVPRRGYMLNAQYLVEVPAPVSITDRIAARQAAASATATPRRNWAANALSGIGALVLGRR